MGILKASRSGLDPSLKDQTLTLPL